LASHFAFFAPGNFVQRNGALALSSNAKNGPMLQIFLAWPLRIEVMEPLFVGSAIWV